MMCDKTGEEQEAMRRVCTYEQILLSFASIFGVHSLAPLWLRSWGSLSSEDKQLASMISIVNVVSVEEGWNFVLDKVKMYYTYRFSVCYKLCFHVILFYITSLDLSYICAR